MSLRSRITSFLNDVRPISEVTVQPAQNFVDTVVNNKTEVNVDVPAFPEFPNVPFDERLVVAVVNATATKALLGASAVDVKKYTDDVYRITAALIAAQRRNYREISEAYWTRGR